MNDQAGRLVHEDDVIVLMQEREVERARIERRLRYRLPREAIALANPIGALRDGVAADADAAGPNVPLDLAPRDVRAHVGEHSVKTGTVLVGSHSRIEVFHF